jgi:ArsR family transcriptional regulator, arsenate/arsenite/antimonite-responsive transcriptional repressor
MATATAADPISTAACCAPLGSESLSDAEAEATARVFKALADPHRVRIVNMLATSPDPVCVCEFTESLGLSQPTVSHHLKKLVAAGLLRPIRTSASRSCTAAARRRRADPTGRQCPSLRSFDA